MAARIHKIRHDDETRAKIQTTQLINRLQDHILKGTRLVPTQVNAALGLLKKTLPDLSQSEITKTVRHEATDYTRDELIALLEQSKQDDGGAGTLTPDGRGGEPDSIH